MYVCVLVFVSVSRPSENFLKYKLTAGRAGSHVGLQALVVMGNNDVSNLVVLYVAQLAALRSPL